jgi:hypothetical protein
LVEASVTTAEWGLAGSIPDGVVAVFHCPNPTGRTMALGSAQTLIEMCTGNVSWELKAMGV